MSSYLTNYPRPENYQDSVFYWWFEFLKRSESYEHQCEIGEGGTVYQDFGNVFGVDFLEWWNNDDRELLFLPGTSFGVWPVENIKDLKQALSEQWLVVKIDPRCTKKTILYWLEEMLFSQQPEVRGHRNVGVTELPKYEPFTTADVQGLKKTLAIYDLYLVEPKPLYKIYEKIQLRDDIRKFKCKDKEKNKNNDDDSTSRRVKTSSISRYIKQAQKLIKNVEQGVFPKSY